LQQIAGATEGGVYLPLRGAKAIDTLYDQGLAKLPKSQHQEKFVRQYHERYHWPLAVAIVLLLVEMLFPERKREPRAKPAAAPRAQPAFPTAVTLLLLLLPAALQGSPASALREYKAGNFDQALKEYEQLLKRKSDDPRLHFNAGAAAYRDQQFEEAAKQFNATLAAPDLNMQGLAYYNEGNALFHVGERNPDPKKRTEAWEKALQDYQSTAKLNPEDADAKYNYEFVKRKLAELKQQQSQQNKSDQQKNQDPQKQQQDQQKNDQQQQQQAQQNQSEQKKDSSQQAQQAQQAQQKKQQEQQQAANQSQEQKEKQQQEQQQAKQSPEQPKDKGDEKEQEVAAAQAAGQMTPEQAQQLLDAQKSDEQMLPPQPASKPADRSRPIKDW
jgi:Ca-activated chloride channel family protein